MAIQLPEAAKGHFNRRFLALPVSQAPAGMEILMQAYHPGDATPELPVPDQPEP